jgi:hypothetical protein
MFNNRRIPLTGFGWIVLAALLTSCSHSNASTPTPAPPGPQDPPDRVARLSYVSGTVSFKAAGTDEWVAAVLNRPLTSGDELWVAEDSRAELDLGHAFVRLDDRTNSRILSLDDRFVQMSIPQGTAQVKLRRLDEGDDFEVDTPQAALTLLRTGDYRADVADDGRTSKATVRSGEIEASTPSENFLVHTNEQTTLTDRAAGGVTYNISSAPPLDAFDTFCQTRDQRLEPSPSDANVSPYVIGREDLSIYGSWRTYPSYGPVWIPRTIPPGWAPYRFGHWVWIAPWGWTWVDDAPWGFAPFHYGRWVIVDGFWVWVPGPVRIRAIYAPALVVFVGGGPGLRYHVSLGVGLGLAWFPLGPREVYIPPYRSTRVYVTNVNISNTTVVNANTIWRTDMSRQRYANRNAPGGITAVGEDVFINARPVGPAVGRIDDREARSLQVVGTAAPVAPSQASLAMRSPDTRAPRPPAAAEQRRVTVQRQPDPAAVPLERQRPALDRDPGRPTSPQEMDQLRRQQPAPDYRRSRQPQPAPSTNPPAQPPVRRERTPQPSPPQPAPRDTDTRRRTIEQEHQRSDQQHGTTGQPPARGRR